MTSSDSETRDVLAGPAGDWVRREAAPASGGHLDLDELIAYHAGLLSGDEQRRIQDHLEVCRDCVETLLELDSFTGSEPEGERARGAAGTADFETAAAWRALRPRLPVASTESSRAVPHGSRWTAAAAAVLALAVVGLTLYTASLRERQETASRPQQATRVYLSAPEYRGDEGDEPAAGQATAGGYSALVMTLSDPRPDGPYRLEIRDAKGRLRWSGAGFEADPLGVLDLIVPPGFLAPGEYTLEVHGGEAVAGRPFDSFPVRVLER